MPTIDIQDLQAIAKLQHPNSNFSSKSIPIEMIETAINAIESKATTLQEQALGYFTQKKFKRLLDTLNKWEQRECKQLLQFQALQMFGQHILPPKDKEATILKPHCQYHIKRCGK